MNKRIVLGGAYNWHGLGDQLQFSTLPELFTELGYDVYISEECNYRNMEIKDLVWRTHPYIKGFVNEPAQAGHPVPMQQVTSSIVSNWEIAHFGKVFNKYPKLYYKPKILPELQGKVLLDLSAGSDPYVEDILEKAVVEKLGDTPNTDVLQIAFEQDISLPHNGEVSVYLKDKYPTYTVRSIFEYVDCIASCKEFVCLMSGGAVVSSALQHMSLTPPTTVFMSVPKKIFKFDNINYVEL